MGRISTTVFVMMLCMNAAAITMEASGLNEDLGVDIETGVDEGLTDSVETLKKGFDPSTAVVESFVAIGIGAGKTFTTVISGIFLLPTMMTNLLGGSDLVEVIVAAFMAPMYAISGLELISIILGHPTVR
jgi:hypothetical protein